MWIEESMIRLTCAPESENVMTVRGCFKVASASSSLFGTVFASNCMKSCLKSDSRARSIMSSTGSTLRLAASSATLGLPDTGLRMTYMFS